MPARSVHERPSAPTCTRPSGSKASAEIASTSPGVKLLRAHDARA